MVPLSTTSLEPAICAGASGGAWFRALCAITSIGVIPLTPISSVWPRYCFPSQMAMVAFPFFRIRSWARRIENAALGPAAVHGLPERRAACAAAPLCESPPRTRRRSPGQGTGACTVSPVPSGRSLPWFPGGPLPLPMASRSRKNGLQRGTHANAAGSHRHISGGSALVVLFVAAVRRRSALSPSRPPPGPSPCCC